MKRNPGGSSLGRNSKLMADSFTDLVDPSSWVVHLLSLYGLFPILICFNVCDGANIINIACTLLKYKVLTVVTNVFCT